MEISASHSLKLSYRSKCENLHGHNWIITVYCRSEVLNEDGMVVDFTHIKETVMGRLDHRNLNEVVSFNPTAENMSKDIYKTTNNLLTRALIDENSKLLKPGEGYTPDISISKIRLHETTTGYTEYYED